MPLSNTQTRFGSLTKALHWATALGIVTMIPLGVIASDAAYDTAEQLAWKAQLFSLHKTLGVALFFLALTRIAWAISQPKPAPLHPERRLETFAAETVHWLLYGALVVVPLSGWLHHAASAGFAPILWPLGQSLPFVPQDTGLSEIFAAVHRISEKVLVGALLLHVAGAIKHHVIDKDATLRRMLPGKAQAGTPGAHRSVLASLAAAGLVFAGAMGIGAAQGAFSSHDRPASVALAEVASDWTVQEGTLNLTIRQFGQEVSGSFADWQAAISYDESASNPRGTVEVEIAIGALSLGSVTAQAMGPDFFNAEAYPTAKMTGEIHSTDSGLELRGSLDLSGAQIPVTLPFDLSIDGDTAMASGALTLDRRDFGIGAAMTDESQLSFSVEVRFDLTATRQ